MSLDVYLKSEKLQPRQKSSGIFIREDGQTKEISREEWDRRYPDREPVAFFSGDEETDTLYSANITHNLGEMADKARLYMPLWRPEEIGLTKAKDLIKPLTEGLALLQSHPEHFKEFNPPNGWGTYEILVGFVESYLAACREYPEARVETDR